MRPEWAVTESYYEDDAPDGARRARTGALWGTVSTASANDGTVFAGCITNRTDTTVTLDTSAEEHITIDTTWLKRAT